MVEVVLVLIVLVLKEEVLVVVVDVEGNGEVVGTVRLELVNGSSGVVVSH